MTRFSFAVCLLATASALVSRTAPAAEYRSPGPGVDFPTADSYYPPVAARAGEQGTAVIHVCVDAQGKLTEPPSLAGSTGNDVLDAGAINLANAGSGHYRPATRDGVPVAGCGAYRVAFKLRGSPVLPLVDPRFPNISARIAKLHDEWMRRMQARYNEFGVPHYIESLPTSGNPAAERVMRQYARSVDSLIDETVGMAADFLDDIDYLQDSPEFPEAERAAFREEWPKNRSALVVSIREVIGTLRELVRVEDELGDYVAFSVARRSSKDSSPPAASADDPHLNALRQRARAALEKLRSTTGAPPDSGNQP